ncbi:MAG: ATP-binding cassette domain-containing protein [Ezakiella sp.]|nr:ATP-binding cassette domain-containing protein [Bacillota bacterium]MDY3946431.1 ATP-binding cassette domain-containing protein [Ezakiella sp.]
MLLSIRKASMTIDYKELFKVDNLNVNSGDRIGLVGANGCGKTSFLNAIYNEEFKSEQFYKSGLWAYFKQRDITKLKDLSGEEASRWNINYLIDRKDNSFSGGEEVRLRLMEAFNTPHDIIMLDEPTAHLDIDGISELKTRLYLENTFILVSHDRELLNEFCDRLWIIEDGKLIDFLGNYDDWIRERDINKLSELREYENAIEEKKRLLNIAKDQQIRAQRSQKKPKHLSKSEIKAREFGAVGKSIGGKEKSMSKAAKNTLKRIDRLGEIKKPSEDIRIKPDFSITDPPQNKIIIEIDDLSFSYGDTEIFSNASFALKRNTRTALLGVNGTGKTTLINLILNHHPDIRIVPKAKLGHFDQSFKNIDFNKSIIDNMRSVSIQKEHINRATLLRMGFSKDGLDKPARTLSGGELTKLSFAMLNVSDINVLLIDEPSNYLDINSYEAIESLLLDFEGTMLFCSHDGYFIDSIAEERWEIKNKKLFKL